MRRYFCRLLGSLAVLLQVATACITATPTPSPALTATATLIPTLALVSLPQDDAPHSNFSTEWWYYSGHLNSVDGAHYAFHYVVFQLAVPELPLVNVAHLSISDPKGGSYVIDQRGGVASPRGEDTMGFSFDLDGWRMSGYGGRDHLSAFTGDYAFDLSLEEEKPPVLHDGTGLVDFGDAGKSYYYSRTRLVASGAIKVSGTEVPVSGQVWFDHQWGDFQAQAIGWDWFGLQLSDGSDVMITLLRDEADRTLSAYGTLIAPDGTAVHLAADEFRASSTGTWASPDSSALYPSGWHVNIPDWGINVTLTPTVEHAEFDATSTTRNYYWEGEVTVTGSHDGTGFVELTGYAPAKSQRQ